MIKFAKGNFESAIKRERKRELNQKPCENYSFESEMKEIYCIFPELQCSAKHGLYWEQSVNKVIVSNIYMNPKVFVKLESISHLIEFDSKQSSGS